MNLRESFRVALDMLRTHKLRALLTMLGVIIGVMAVTLVVMLSEGFQYYLSHEFQKLGANTFFVAYDPGGGRSGRRVRGTAIENMKLSDVQYLRDRCPKLDVVTGMLTIPSTKVSYLDREVSNPSIEGYDEFGLELNKVAVIEGRGMTKDDMVNRANVCLIGTEIRDRLFKDGSPIGKLVTFPNMTLEVVGVMDKVEILGQNNGKDIWVPITTAHAKWVGADNLTYVTALPKKGVKTDEAMDEAWRAMMLKSGNKRVYRIDSRESILGVLNSLISGAGVLLALVAALSLLVGGIGIMNIMLVSVTERTREVGLRKALGAPKTAILTQFLVEAMVLSLVGGMIGMMIAYLFGIGINLLTSQANWPSKGGIPVVFPIVPALFAAGFSAVIGVVFGLYPALRAASLSPIEALRTE